VTTAAICTIGDELLAGDVIDSNGAWMAAELAALGIEVTMIASVGDALLPLTDEVRHLLEAHDVVVCSGGLGPTSDDRTREAVAAATGHELERHQDLADRLTEWFASRGVQMPAANLQQADVPAGAVVLPPKGTAPGFALELDGGRLVAALPGVPWELRSMFRDALVPLLVERTGIRPSVTRVVHVSGLGESACAERLQSLEADLPDGVEIAYLASGGELRVKLTARDDDRGQARARTDEPLTRAVELLGEHVVAIDGGSLEEVVITRYTAAGRTIAVAESASGGILADRLASPDGASAVFLGGAVVYSADAKHLLADVPRDVLEEHGTVSRATTEALAVGIRERLGADVGAATTGVAGAEPVEGCEPGTMIWAIATEDGVRSRGRTASAAGSLLERVRPVRPRRAAGRELPDAVEHPHRLPARRRARRAPGRGRARCRAPRTSWRGCGGAPRRRDQRQRERLDVQQVVVPGGLEARACGTCARGAGVEVGHGTDQHGVAGVLEELRQPLAAGVLSWVAMRSRSG
jgi:nicotinamide-nucleotide amidase